jgi:hypothetical protein
MRKQLIFYSLLFALSLNSCNGQKKEGTGAPPAENQPKTSIKVDKEYDENGNLIRYDSSYSYYYSNIENDTLLRDSIFDQFRFHFNQKYFFSEEPFFNDLFFQDSLLKFDFYKNDFFSNRFRSNMEHIDRLFNEMDSIKNQFFMDQFKDKPEIKEK